MLAATRSSSMELPRPKGPPKYQRRSRCFPLPICGSRMAPLLRWACRLMRLRVDFEVSQTSIAVAGDMPHSSSLRATFAVERSTMLPDIARTTILARDPRKINSLTSGKKNQRPHGGVGGGEFNNILAIATLLRKSAQRRALEYAYSGCTMTRHGTVQSDTGGVEVGARGW